MKRCNFTHNCPVGNHPNSWRTQWEKTPNRVSGSISKPWKIPETAKKIQLSWPLCNNIWVRLKSLGCCATKKDESMSFEITLSVTRAIKWDLSKGLFSPIRRTFMDLFFFKKGKILWAGSQKCNKTVFWEMISLEVCWMCTFVEKCNLQRCIQLFCAQKSFSHQWERGISRFINYKSVVTNGQCWDSFKKENFFSFKQYISSGPWVSNLSWCPIQVETWDAYQLNGAWAKKPAKAHKETRGQRDTFHLWNFNNAQRYNWICIIEFDNNLRLLDFLRLLEVLYKPEKFSGIFLFWALFSFWNCIDFYTLIKIAKVCSYPNGKKVFFASCNFLASKNRRPIFMSYRVVSKVWLLCLFKEFKEIFGLIFLETLAKLPRWRSKFSPNFRLFLVEKGIKIASLPKLYLSNFWRALHARKEQIQKRQEKIFWKEVCFGNHPRSKHEKSQNAQLMVREKKKLIFLEFPMRPSQFDTFHAYKWPQKS